MRHMSEALEDTIAEELDPDVELEPDQDEDTDQDEATAPEPEPQPEDEPLSEKDIEKLNRSLENEASRHTKRVGEIMGDDAVALVQCEACDPKIPGWHWPAEIFPEGTPERTLYEMLAGGTEAQMKHPPRYVTCTECNGFGQVLTGARNDIHRLLICPACKGSGYHDREETTAPVVQLASPVVVPVEGFEQAHPPSPEKDFVGRPIGHPNYGKMSTYLTPEEQALDARDGYVV